MIWTAERNQAQGALVAEMYAAAGGVPCERVAAIAGGLPGADKDAVLLEAGLDRSAFLTVSVDAVLAAMAGAGLIEAPPGQSPLSQAGRVHGEAQFLAKRLALRAAVDGRNLILDVTLASQRSAEAWTYALRFADYTVGAVFAQVEPAEAVRRSEQARRRGEEEFGRGQGHGGRPIPAAAIEALATPEAAATRDRIGWALGAQSASTLAGAGVATGMPPGGSGTGTFPRSALMQMIASYCESRLSLDELELEFRVRRWPQVPDVCPPSLAAAQDAVDDLEPYMPGSFDDAVLAYDLGWLSDADYAVLAPAADPAPAAG